jgi:hypothetical protein
MRDELVQILSRVPSDALSVYLFVEARASLDTKVGLTQQEVSRATRLSVAAVRESLGWLEQPSYRDAGLKTIDPLAPFVSIDPKGKAYLITCLEPYSDGRRLRFTFQDTDDRRIAVLETELRRLARNDPSSARLSLYLKGERQALIREIEGDLGRPITVHEAFLLGELVSMVSVERVRTQWRTKAHQMSKPIIGITAMFKNKAFGAKAKHDVPEEEGDVSYQPLVRDDTPV